jgi:hypothetical protein
MRQPHATRAQTGEINTAAAHDVDGASIGEQHLGMLLEVGTHNAWDITICNITRHRD